MHDIEIKCQRMVAQCPACPIVRAVAGRSVDSTLLLLRQFKEQCGLIIQTELQNEKIPVSSLVPAKS